MSLFAIGDCEMCQKMEIIIAIYMSSLWFWMILYCHCRCCCKHRVVSIKRILWQTRSHEVQVTHLRLAIGYVLPGCRTIATGMVTTYLSKKIIPGLMIKSIRVLLFQWVFPTWYRGALLKKSRMLCLINHDGQMSHPIMISCLCFKSPYDLISLHVHKWSPEHLGPCPYSMRCAFYLSMRC